MVRRSDYIALSSQHFSKEERLRAAAAKAVREDNQRKPVATGIWSAIQGQGGAEIAGVVKRGLGDHFSDTRLPSGVCR